MEAAGGDDGCVTGGAVVGIEARSGGIHHHHCIGLVFNLGGDAVIYFCMPSRTKGESYYVGGGVLCQRQRQKGKLAQMMRKYNN